MSVRFATLPPTGRRKNSWGWSREQEEGARIRQAYIEAMGREPKEAPDKETRVQFLYGIGKGSGGYIQPSKSNRADFVQSITR